MRQNLQKRFPNHNRLKKPYNALTLTDPRFLDLYFSEYEVKEAVEVIKNDRIFAKEKENEAAARIDSIPVIVEAEPPSKKARKETNVRKGRRDELLKRRDDANTILGAPFTTSVDKKIDDEIKLLRQVSPIDEEKNPLKWYKQNFNTFPYLTKFYLSAASFQATSVASERIFNKDALIYDERRTKILPETSEHLIVLQDYYVSRENDDKFSLCSECPGNRNRYRLTCRKHNSSQKEKL